MARAPRARVSQTSGQGISRLSYQKGYSLGNMKGSAAPGVSTKFEGTDKREYSKKQEYPAGINVSYGDTIEPTDLKDTKAMFASKPTKSGVSTATGKAKKLK